MPRSIAYMLISKWVAVYSLSVEFEDTRCTDGQA